ncbi:MAG: TolC family protein [Bryobacteraceae bacterium]
MALAAEGEPLQLTLKRAVELALSPEGSARVQISAEMVRQAETRAAQARAALLPNFEAGFTGQNLTRNLAAMGIRFDLPLSGFRFPATVGPFNVLDARATGSQSIFDFASIRRFQSARSGLDAARAERTVTEDQVAAQVARAYLRLLKADADVEAVRANVTLAGSVLELAESQKRAGTGTGIEITRARVQLSSERQRLLVAENERRRAQLELARAIGLRLDTPIQPAAKLEFTPVDPVTLGEAKTRALKERADVLAQQERESGARLASGAVKWERLPTVAAFGDYGSIGTGFGSMLPTRTYGISLRVPLFDGGRRDARRAEAASQYRAEVVRTRDLKEQVDLEIRLALDALASAAEQVEVAREGLALAESELTQARRRYQAGVATGLEVTDAQTRLERARDNQTAALFNHNLARIDLAQATGTIRRELLQ